MQTKQKWMLGLGSVAILAIIGLAVGLNQGGLFKGEIGRQPSSQTIPLNYVTEMANANQNIDTSTILATVTDDTGATYNVYGDSFLAQNVVISQPQSRSMDANTITFDLEPLTSNIKPRTLDFSNGIFLKLAPFSSPIPSAAGGLSVTPSLADQPVSAVLPPEALKLANPASSDPIYNIGLEKVVDAPFAFQAPVAETPVPPVVVAPPIAPALVVPKAPAAVIAPPAPVNGLKLAPPVYKPAALGLRGALPVAHASGGVYQIDINNIVKLDDLLLLPNGAKQLQFQQPNGKIITINAIIKNPPANVCVPLSVDTISFAPISLLVPDLNAPVDMSTALKGYAKSGSQINLPDLSQLATFCPNDLANLRIDSNFAGLYLEIRDVSSSVVVATDTITTSAMNSGGNKFNNLINISSQKDADGNQFVQFVNQFQYNPIGKGGLNILKPGVPYNVSVYSAVKNPDPNASAQLSKSNLFDAPIATYQIDVAPQKLQIPPPNPADFTQSTLTADPLILPINTSTTLTATLKTAKDEPIGGAPVTVQTASSQVFQNAEIETWSPNPPNLVTSTAGSSLGTATATVSESEPGDYEYQAIAEGGAVKTKTVKVTFTAPNAQAQTPTSANSDFIATPTTVDIDGTSTSTLIATAKDSNGKSIGNVPVTVKRIGCPETLDQCPTTLNETWNPLLKSGQLGPSLNTTSTGVATFSVMESLPGTYTYEATIGNFTKTATVTFQTPSSKNPPSVPSETISTFTAFPSSLNIGAGSAILTATVFDAVGHPVPNAKVTISTSFTGGSGTFTTIGNPTTNNLGVATATHAASTPATYIYVAHLDDINKDIVTSAPVTVTFNTTGTGTTTTTGTGTTTQPCMVNGIAYYNAGGPDSDYCKAIQATVYSITNPSTGVTTQRATFQVDLKASEPQIRYTTAAGARKMIFDLINSQNLNYVPKIRSTSATWYHIFTDAQEIAALPAQVQADTRQVYAAGVLRGRLDAQTAAITLAPMDRITFIELYSLLKQTVQSVVTFQPSLSAGAMPAFALSYKNDPNQVWMYDAIDFAIEYHLVTKNELSVNFLQSFVNRGDMAQTLADFKAYIEQNPAVLK